jgi:hypothetical protein
MANPKKSPLNAKFDEMVFKMTAHSLPESSSQGLHRRQRGGRERGSLKRAFEHPPLGQGHVSLFPFGRPAPGSFPSAALHADVNAYGKVKKSKTDDQDDYDVDDAWISFQDDGEDILFFNKDS